MRWGVLILGVVACDARAPANSEQREVVSAAAELLADGERLEVDADFPSASCGGVGARYALGLDGSFVTLQLREHFVEESGNENAREIVDHLRACLPEMQRVFLRYGVRFSMALTTSWERAAPPNDAIVVALAEEFGRGDAYHFDADMRCATLLHELGHHLGLADEYRETGTCREWQAPDASIMSLPNEELEALDFMPRHLRRILAPVHARTMPRCLRLREYDSRIGNERVMLASGVPQREVTWSDAEATPYVAIAFSSPPPAGAELRLIAQTPWKSLYGVIGAGRTFVGEISYASVEQSVAEMQNAARGYAAIDRCD